MTSLTIVIGEDYIPELKKRMEKYGITPAELARELGKHEQELSRWFNSKKRFGKQWTPRMSNIMKIEQAIIDIRRRKARQSTPAKKTPAKVTAAVKRTTPAKGAKKA